MTRIFCFDLTWCRDLTLVTFSRATSRCLWYFACQLLVLFRPLGFFFFLLFRPAMDALRRAKYERRGHRGIVTKTITELDILLANPADPNDLAATTKQLKSLNVYKMKLERERDALPAFDEKVQAGNSRTDKNWRTTSSKLTASKQLSKGSYSIWKPSSRACNAATRLTRP